MSSFTPWSPTFETVDQNIALLHILVFRMTRGYRQGPQGLEKGLEFHFEISDLEVVGKRSGIYIKYHENDQILDLECP